MCKTTVKFCIKMILLLTVKIILPLNEGFRKFFNRYFVRVHTTIENPSPV